MPATTATIDRIETLLIDVNANEQGSHQCTAGDLPRTAGRAGRDTARRARPSRPSSRASPVLRFRAGIS